MFFFNFPKKNNNSLSDKERYGQAWIQIVGERYRSTGLQTMKKLSDEGFIEASVALAMFADNPYERKALYKKAADKNNPEGLWGYSGFLQHSYVPDINNPDDAKWEDVCTRAAKSGSVDAMNELGNTFNRRNQFPQSMYWYAMANANGFPCGEISLKGLADKWIAAGMPYEFEETEGFTNAHYKCAMFYLELWADQEITTPIDEYVSLALDGEPLAAYLAGDAFESEGNFEMAYKIYNAIAFENDAHGIKCYADMLFTGRGTEKDIQSALKMYTMSAELGDRASMFIVGEFTKGTNANLAAYWYGVAHSRGYEYALQRLIQLSGK